jgi:predicted component of type VI protein secretion system
MPYIVVKSNGQEIDRRELTGPLVVGRAPDCDLVVPDILLSRRHCRIESTSSGWGVLDLQSKNGTVINGERLGAAYHLLDNDVVRLGRSRIIFHEGVLEEDLAVQPSPMGRPLDPGDTLSGTLSGFTLLLPGEGDIPQDNMPCPQPRPKDPPAYDQEELQTLLTAIASSSWDSIYAESRKPTLVRAEAKEGQSQRRVRPRSPTDFSLQVSPPPSVAVPVRLDRVSPPQLPGHRRQRRRLGPRIHVIVAGMWLAAIVLASRQWRPLASGSIAGPAAPPPTAIASAPLIPPPPPSISPAKALMPINMNKSTLWQIIKSAALHFPIIL